MIEFWEVVGAPRSDADQAPVTYVISGTWPEVTLTADAPVSAHFALAFAQRLAAALAASEMSGRAAAAAAGLSHATVQRVLRGEVLPDLGTLARLEVALRVDLYPVGLHTRFPSVNSPSKQ
ncbi:helix-turn-helix transcriptional regulator [Amycolatopsis sp. DG1A-15b]|uniref:helix-turn-helix domain-containing protein n=1 Tax=Amycolatopsis sp. DG1A-15b TaxID=3052846 RepID=UPI00255BEBBD|nr:helix-turn-helix transcriptional regulator [Amycolatopsis sp. DG1A-15b]WIX91355.1 helix-turn-helix transcriptional regulator [Amycolatopsis sp. DG1A-15b]